MSYDQKGAKTIAKHKILKGRRVRCAATGEYGNSLEFIKIGNNYYKSNEAYEEDLASKETSKEIIRMICEDFLGYPTGGAFPRGITRGLAGLKVYPREVVLKTLHEVYEPVMYQFNQGGKFKSDNGKVAYLFAVVCNNINPIYKRYKESQNLLERQQARDATAAEDLAFYEMDAPRSDKPGKDISAMLEDLGI